MLIIFKQHVTNAEINDFNRAISGYGKLISIDGRNAVIVSKNLLSQTLCAAEIIEEIVEFPDKLYFTKYVEKPLKIANLLCGDRNILAIAGPCAIESEQQIFASAQIVKEAGAQILRGGAFKPRSSCYDFQGLGNKGLQLLHVAARAHGLLCISEIMDSKDLDKFDDLVDIIQVGARNMQNYALLKELGQIRKPIVLKRGLAATYQDLLLSAEYLMSAGNQQVILCERGIRTFESATRNTLDISAIPYLQSKTNCPVIVDPSHAIGMRDFVPQLAYAAVAAGADGIMLEVHPEPDTSISDAKQTIDAETFKQAVSKMREIANLFDKTFGA